MNRNIDVKATQPQTKKPTTATEVRGRVTPAVDVYETADGYVLLVDLPGASRETIDLTMEGGTLSLRAEAGAYHPPDARLVYRELVVPLYERSFAIGDGVDRVNIDARFENGVLAVKLFKREDRKPREITIR